MSCPLQGTVFEKTLLTPKPFEFQRWNFQDKFVLPKHEKVNNGIFWFWARCPRKYSYLLNRLTYRAEIFRVNGTWWKTKKSLIYFHDSGHGIRDRVVISLTVWRTELKFSGLINLGEKLKSHLNNFLMLGTVMEKIRFLCYNFQGY